MDEPSRPGGFVPLVDDLETREREWLLSVMTHDEAWGTDSTWENWRHEGQEPPPEPWRTWVLMAGRGFGKTRAGAEWVARQAREWGPSETTGGSVPRETFRIALVGATIDDARRVMVEGASGLLAVAGDEIRNWYPTRRLLKFASGAEATLFSGASPDALRGPEHHIAWCDELAKWEKPGETWDMLQLGLRLGRRPRALVTTTPRPGADLKRIMAAGDCQTTGGATAKNPHLPRAYVDAVHDLYAGTRLARQELEGVLLTDTPGALWTVELLERCRAPLDHALDSVRPEHSRGAPASVQAPLDASASLRGAFARDERLPFARNETFLRVVLGVDPPAGDGTCGIVACARDKEGWGYVLADHSVTARSPETWARAVAAAAEVHGATLVVAEVNQGGRMVDSVLRASGCRTRVRPVRAAVGKSERAEPVATLFEAGRVRLCGRFPELEAQLCGLIAGGGYEGPGMSPDRADAMVWALTELMLGKEREDARVRVV